MLGGNFGIWGGLFSSFDCAVKGYRQKEDPWNAIISGFLTGGTLALRGAYMSRCHRARRPRQRDYRSTGNDLPAGQDHDWFGHVGLVNERRNVWVGRGGAGGQAFRTRQAIGS